MGSMISDSYYTYEEFGDAAQTLTFGLFTLSADPQVEEGRALVKQWVWIFCTDPVDVINTELKLSCQLLNEEKQEY